VVRASPPSSRNPIAGHNRHINGSDDARRRRPFDTFLIRVTTRRQDREESNNTKTPRCVNESWLKEDQIGLLRGPQRAAMR
jgi:hypothetical protein